MAILLNVVKNTKCRDEESLVSRYHLIGDSYEDYCLHCWQGYRQLLDFIVLKCIILTTIYSAMLLLIAVGGYLGLVPGYAGGVVNNGVEVCLC